MYSRHSQGSIDSGQGQSIQISSDNDLESIASQSPLDPSDHDEAPSEQFVHKSERPGDERPNRYKGKVEDWREYTRVERGIAAGLDKMQATDLSRHLFNAYALRSRSNASDTQLWRPKSYWTAWPLPPSLVPRMQEQHSQQPVPGSSVKLPSSRLELEEVIIAIMTKEARQRVLHQMWMNAYGHTLEPPASEYDSCFGQLTARGSKREPGNPDNTLRVSRKAQHPHPTDSAGLGSQKHTLPLAIPSIDPEFEFTILRPSARQTLANFNTLLMALHRSRRNLKPSGRMTRGPAGLAPRSSSMRSAGSKTTMSSFGERSTSREMSIVPAASRQRRHKSDDRQDTAEDSSHRSRQKLRDWTDVLGMAAISRSFDPVVIARARSRTEKLIGEKTRQIP